MASESGRKATGPTLMTPPQVFKKAYVGAYVPLVKFELPQVGKKRLARGLGKLATTVTHVDLEFDVASVFVWSQMKGFPPIATNGSVLIVTLYNYPWGPGQSFFWRSKYEENGAWGPWDPSSGVYSRRFEDAGIWMDLFENPTPLLRRDPSLKGTRAIPWTGDSSRAASS